MTGRCPCGYTGSTCDVEEHQVGCAVYAAAYRADPDGMLSAADEYASWLEHGRLAERAAAHQKSVADTDTRRGAMLTRFATRDILED